MLTVIIPDVERVRAGCIAVVDASRPRDHRPSRGGPVAHPQGVLQATRDLVGLDALLREAIAPPSVARADEFDKPYLRAALSELLGRPILRAGHLGIYRRSAESESR